MLQLCRELNYALENVIRLVENDVKLLKIFCDLCKTFGYVEHEIL